MMNSDQPTDPKQRPLEPMVAERASSQQPDEVQISDPHEQSARARSMLVRLTWLVLALVVGGMAWLRHNQIKVEEQVSSRLRINEEFTQRLNSIDDKLFALTPAQSRVNAAEQVATNDWQLVGVQVVLATRLYESGDLTGAGEVLRALRYQLDAGQLAIAAPMRATLKQNLLRDIEYLAVAQSQPDAWQLHMVKMKEIQAYLRGLNRYALSQQISRQDLLLNDANVVLNLALGAAARRDRDMMTHYLHDLADTLQQLDRLMPSKDALESTADKSAQNDESVTMDKNIQSVPDAGYAVNELLANTPKLTPLVTTTLIKNNPPK